MKKPRLKILLMAGCMAALCLGFAACGEATLPPEKNDADPSEEIVQQVKDYYLDSTRVYAGGLLKGKPEGEGIIRYKNGSTLQAVFSQGKYTYGTYTYANTMHYTGGFKDGKFHGQGTFDWRTYNPDGSMLNDGWLYEGAFTEGTIIGCIGRLTFNRTGKGSGTHWFEGEMGAFPGVKREQSGKAHILFNDNSYYEGDVYCTKEGTFVRYGVGVQNFFDTKFTGKDVGCNSAEKLWCYAGEFDSIDHGWMYGDGVMYFCDGLGVPTGYLKGNWNGMSRVGSYSGDWSDDMLLDEWKGTVEFTDEKG